VSGRNGGQFSEQFERGGKAPACHQPDWIKLAEQSDQPPSVCSLYVKAGRPQLRHSRPQPSHVEQAAALARLLQV